MDEQELNSFTHLIQKNAREKFCGLEKSTISVLANLRQKTSQRIPWTATASGTKNGTRDGDESWRSQNGKTMNSHLGKTTYVEVT